jgi:hypothetical protein
MVALGHRLKHLPRAYLVRSSFDSRHKQEVPALTLSAITGPEQSQQKSPLLDHLVGKGEELNGNGEAE